MKLEIREGKRGLLLVVVFEKDTNYDPEKHEWVPRFSELRKIKDILRRIAPWEP
jgi:hypothetical protein